MLLGRDEIKTEVKGLFKKFYYRQTINRNDKTKHFKCFKDNDKQSHSSITFVYARNEKDFLDLLTYWSNFYSDKSYDYNMVSSEAVKNPWLTVDEVIQDYYSIRKGSVISYDDNIRELIH